MTTDLFDRIIKDKGPLGKWADMAEGYYVFPKLEGPISNRMYFNGKKVVTWSINDYLGLANHPEVLKVDGEAALEHGMAYPMGARMMSGHTPFHEQLERECAEFVDKEKAYLLNFGYQGIMSAIDALVTFNDLTLKSSFKEESGMIGNTNLIDNEIVIGMGAGTISKWMNNLKNNL